MHTEVQNLYQLLHVEVIQKIILLGLEQMYIRMKTKKFSCITSGVSKSEGVVLTEGAKTYSKLRIKEGQLYVKYLYFGWSGNSPKYPAEASVKYNAN